MKKQRLNYAIVCLLLTSVVASVFLFASPLEIPKVLAQYDWSDSFSIYHNITVLEPAIRTVTNTYSFPINVKVYISSTTNIMKLALYKTTGNNTEFIIIQDGDIIRGENSYTNLQPSQTLAFDLFAKPTNTLSIGETVTVEKKVEIYKAYVPPPPPPPPPVIIKFPLDLQIIQLPAIIYQPFQPSFTATLLTINKGKVGTDVTIKWWITDVEGRIYDGGVATIFIDAMEEKEIEIQVPTPKTDGTYTLHTQSTKPTVVVAEAVFQVTIIPLWLIIVTILSICLAIVLIIRRKQKR